MKRSAMRLAAIAATVILAVAGFGAGRAAAQIFDNFSFTMAPTGADEACVKTAKGFVTISPLFGQVENMNVEVTGLPANTDFDLFVIQQPTAPFGLAWYMGDMLTDSKGTAIQDFVGRFSIGTFIVAPGTVAAPVVLKGDASSNPTTAPVQLYNLGLWFDKPADAGKATCATTTTPFNSTHNAGVQVLNTAVNGANPRVGPLFHEVDR
jgi:hypothetical protein